MHLAEILALGLRGVPLGRKPEQQVERPGRRRRVRRGLVRRIVPFGSRVRQ
jgi:hypothetical protein